MEIYKNNIELYEKATEEEKELIEIPELSTTD